MQELRHHEPQRVAVPAAIPGHIVRFHDDDQELANAVAHFLAEGFAAGESLVVIATAERTALFEERVNAKGFDVAMAKAAGSLVTMDAAEALERFMTDGEPDWGLFQSTVGTVVARAIANAPGGRVRAYGEMVDVLWQRRQPEAALTLEGFWDRLREKYPLSLLCGYVMGNFFNESQSDGFRRVCEAHQHVVPANDLGSDFDVRQRQISLLQQRALALQTELLRRRELEEALRQARSEAAAASRAKDEFMAMLGHELRNPLSPMLTALELLRLRGDGQLGKEHAILERQTRHLVRLVDDLLDISRVTRGLLQLRRQRVDLADAMAKAIDIASPLLEARRQHLDAPALLPGALVVDGDEARLAQVFANLLTNAAKYTPPGGHVAVRARRSGG